MAISLIQRIKEDRKRRREGEIEKRVMAEEIFQINKKTIKNVIEKSTKGYEQML